MSFNRKAKGRRLQNSVTLRLRRLYENILHQDDIRPQVMGQNGADVVLTPSAKNLIAFDIECKNMESLVGAALSDAIAQCEANSTNDRIPLLIFKRNQEPERVILRLDDFLSLVYPHGDVEFSMDTTQRALVLLEKLKLHLMEGRSACQARLSSPTPKQPD